MADEIETKVLGIDQKEIVQKLENLGAKKVQETRLTVDWFRPIGVKDGQDPWFLRIRSNSEGKHEVTWKAKSEVLGIARKHKEINFFIDEPAKLADLFKELALETYAHQEKDRVSFTYKNYRFDIDQYPGAPPYLEIESDSEESIKNAIELLGLEKNKTYQQGERVLILEVYGLDWHHMKF